MSLQSDISWIQSELNNVRDPYLIEAFKNLLTYYRKEKVNTAFTKTQFIEEIKEAESQIEKGEYLTIDDFESQSEKWG